VKKRQGDGFSVRADNLQMRPCDRAHDNPSRAYGESEDGKAS
jgi:hypothetical protein